MVHIRIPPASRGLTRQARTERQPRNCLHERTPGLVLAVGANVAEATVGNVDDVRLYLLQLLVTETPFVQHAGREIFRDGVRALDDLGKDLLAFCGSEIQGDAKLVSIVVVE